MIVSVDHHLDDVLVRAGQYDEDEHNDLDARNEDEDARWPLTDDPVDDFGG